MTIICDQFEFAHLVRMCQLSEAENGCRGCLFTAFCSSAKARVNATMTGVEDICVVKE